VEQVVDEADRQLYDEGSIRRELIQLEIDADDGRLDPEEREELEQALMARLAISQARHAPIQEELDRG
jgi:hypothetical protein